MNELARSTSSTQYLTFFVAGEEYAIEVLCVREVVESIPITRVPSMPRVVRGVVNLRGSVVPVIDLGVRFDGRPLEVAKLTCIVVIETNLEGERAVMGLLVDSVNQVIDLSPDAIAPVPAFGTRVRADLLKGMGIVGPKFALLLDKDRLVSHVDLLEAPAATFESEALP